MDRTGKKMTVVEVKVAKDYSYQDSIFQDCLHCLENDSIPEVNVGSSLLYCLYFINFLQYPIDGDLIQELKQKRKELFSKVCFNIMLFFIYTKWIVGGGYQEV